MHDVTDLESRGLPAVLIASTEFIDAAKTQSSALGFDSATVFVAHPIQDRTDDELKALAKDAFESILSQIYAGTSTTN